MRAGMRKTCKKCAVRIPVGGVSDADALTHAEGKIGVGHASYTTKGRRCIASPTRRQE
jgi:hypothetical protein